RPETSRELPSRMRSALNPFNERAVEEINSKGFGSLRIQPLEDQQTQGKGIWENGKWTLTMIRDLKTSSPYDVDFKNGKPVLAAFAIWDGANQDKNANKMVSFWQVLTFH
ncbi:MAG: ethylbenzene dehydrogenase-related protein, partial [Nitrospinota bacterium]|nr:ethylbenzene dehydrogenase-related protein [Nitrospinota bacterium]